ncbi:MAG: lipopolysaccharide biosynthesis protein [Traorella sp.]
MKKSQLKAGIILSYVQIGLNSFISLVYTPVMLRLLGQSEYGIYSLASSMISYLGLLNMGLNSSYIRYYSRYKRLNDKEEEAKLNGIFFLVYLAIAFIAFVLGMILCFNLDLVLKNTYSSYELYTIKILFVILLFNMMMTFVTTVFNAYVSANEEFIFHKLLSIGKNVISPMVTIPLLLLGFRSIGMAVGTTVVCIMVDIANVWFCFKKLNIKFRFKNVDFRIIGEISQYSIFIAINNIVDLINWQVDKFILSSFQGAIATAVYSVASQINNIYMNVSTSISNVFTPRIHMILYDKNNEKKYTKLMIRVGRIQSMVLGMVLIGFILFGRQFVNLWAGKDYIDAFYIAFLLLISSFIPLIQNIGIEIQRAKNKHQFRSIIYIITALLNLAISIPLGKRYGGIGCAIGTSLSILLTNGLIMNLYYHFKLKLNMKEFWFNISHLTLVFIPSFIIGLLIRYIIPGFGAVSLLLRLGCFVIGYCICCWLLGMNQEEKAYLIKILDKIHLFALKILRI